MNIFNYLDSLPSYDSSAILLPTLSSVTCTPEHYVFNEPCSCDLWKSVCENKASILASIPRIKRIVFNNPATIILWEDDTKTVVKAMKDTPFNPYHGFCTAVCKKLFGGNSIIKNVIREYSGFDVDAEAAE